MIKYSDERVFDPQWQVPEVEYGTNLIGKITDTSQRYVLVTMEIPYNLIKDKISRQPEKILFLTASLLTKIL